MARPSPRPVLTMATCPTCKQEAHTFVEMGVLPGAHIAPQKVRKCVNCRQPWPEDPTAPSTSSAAPMPAAASPALAPPPAAAPKANGVARAARLAAPAPEQIKLGVNADRAPPGPLPYIGASPDYEALMRAELDALDAAEEHIARRRVYLTNLLAMLGRTPAPVATAPDLDTN